MWDQCGLVNMALSKYTSNETGIPKWQIALAIGGTVAATAGIYYFLFRDSSKKGSQTKTQSKKSRDSTGSVASPPSEAESTGKADDAANLVSLEWFFELFTRTDLIYNLIDPKYMLVWHDGRSAKIKIHGDIWMVFCLSEVHKSRPIGLLTYTFPSIISMRLLYIVSFKMYLRQVHMELTSNIDYVNTFFKILHFFQLNPAFILDTNEP